MVWRLLFLSLLGLAILSGCESPTSTPVSRPHARPVVKDPYPECAKIRAQLRADSGEPDRLEVVEWNRFVHGPDAELPRLRNKILVRVRYRDVNKFGARQVLERDFLFDAK